MTDQLTGRALDEAAAIAMGWTVEGEGSSRSYYGADGRWRGSVAPSGCHECGQRDDGAPRIEDMTAWLIGQGAELELVYENGHWVATETRPITEELSSSWSSTLNEALARLVVAVAAAKEARRG